MAGPGQNAKLLFSSLSNQPANQPNRSLYLPGESSTRAESNWSYTEFPSLEGNVRRGKQRFLINLLKGFDMYHVRLDSSGYGTKEWYSELYSGCYSSVIFMRICSYI